MLLLVTVAGTIRAQYASLNAILDRLEARKGINKELKNVNIDHKKFFIIKDFDDHTERNFISLDGNKATYVEVFDDKKTGESTSNVFSGDVMRNGKNNISLRCDLLEGRKIALPVTKTFLLTQQKDILYLIDVNTRERWVDEESLKKNK